MKKGIELLEFIQKIVLLLIFGLFCISFFIPNGRIVMIIAFGIFFLFPLTQEFLYYFFKFFYRNIEVIKGFLDEEEDTWEKIKWRVIKVIPFKDLPQILHSKYKKMVDQNYKKLLRDKSFKELNKFLLIDKEVDLEIKKRGDTNNRNST